MQNKERHFLRAKEKLDQLRIPAVFPIECTDLIGKLLALIPSHNSTATYECLNKESKSNQNHRQIDLETRVKVLGAEIQKTVKQNNSLHLEVIHVKQDNEILRKRILLLEGIKINPSENLQVSKMKRSAEKELQDRLSKVTKKHNDLLNKVYGQEDGFEKLQGSYIKKNQEQQFNQSLPPRKNHTLKQEKGSNQMQNNYGKANNSNNSNLLQRIQELKNKVKVRENEILRLQQKMSYDGLNINKLIKDYQQREASREVETLNHQVDLLNKQNFKLKDELKKVKAVSGRGDVLRVQNQKLRNKLDEQKKKNETQSKIAKQDIDKTKSKIDKIKNQFESTNIKKKEVENLADKVRGQNVHLAIKIQELESQLNKAGEQNQELKQRIQSLEEEICTLKNVQQGEKIFLNYELEDYKKKSQEKQNNDRQFSNKLREQSQRMQQINELNRLNQKEMQLKSEQIENLKQMIQEQQNIIDKLQNQQRKLKSPLHRELDYTSEHLNEITQSHKILQTNNQKLRMENDSLKRRLEQANIRQESSFERQHNKLTSQITKLLKINQELRGQLEKSNTNVQNIQSSIIELEQLKQQLKKLNHNLQLERNKNKSLEQENEQLMKTTQIFEEKLSRSRQQSKKLKLELGSVGEKMIYLQQEHALLSDFRNSNSQKVGRMEQEIVLLTNDLKQASITHTILSEENINLKKQIVQLEAINRQLRLSNAEPKDETLLRGDFHNLVGKYETLILVNKNLKEGMAHLKVENEEMMLDRGNFIKEANHLRLLIHELEQRNNQYKQSQELLRKTVKDLQKNQKRQKSASKGLQKQMSNQQLRSKIEEIEESYRQAMKESQDVILRAQY